MPVNDIAHANTLDATGKLGQIHKLVVADAAHANRLETRGAYMTPPPRSGQVNVAVAGTEVRLGNRVVNGALMVKALDTNTGVIAVGNVAVGGVDTVTVDNGFRLAKSESVVFEYVNNLFDIMVDSTTPNQKVCWIIL